MTKLDSPFAPDWVSPPGDTILDIIEERGWSQAELATRLGYSTKHVNQLIKGKVPLTDDAAIRLERVLGSSVSFWLAREAKYRERCARLEAAQRDAAWTAWLDELPVRELMAAGVIAKQRIDAKSKPDLVEKCLRFFGVASPDEWRGHYGDMQCSFRRSRADQSDIGAISSWLRMGEQHAEKLDGPKYNRSLFIKVLTKIRQLTVLPPEEFEPKLREYFKQAGVAFVPKGACKWCSTLAESAPPACSALFVRQDQRQILVLAFP
jgi:HTH-type transcriptional regulator/antitoxin HigA